VSGRRAYAAGAVLALFLVGGVVSGTFQAQGGALEAFAPFVNPLAILDGAREWLFGSSVAGSPVSAAGVAMPVYGLAVVAMVGISWLVLAIRYRSVST
jgi:hypothetical protein